MSVEPCSPALRASFWPLHCILIYWGPSAALGGILRQVPPYRRNAKCYARACQHLFCSGRELVGEGSDAQRKRYSPPILASLLLALGLCSRSTAQCFRRAEAFHNVEQPVHDLRQLVEKSQPLLCSRVACWLWRGGACRPESWHWRALLWWTRGRPRRRAASLSFRVPRSHLSVAILLSGGPG